MCLLTGKPGARLSLDPRGFDRCTAVGWSPDGALLTLACASGAAHAYLARMHICHSSYKTSVAYLSSLREVRPQ